MGVLLAALIASGCGDGGGGTEATDFDGFWVLSSMTMDFGGMTGEATVTRGGMPMGLIGDGVFTSSSATEGTLDFRFAPIEDNQMAAEAIVFLGSIEVESDRWILHNPNDPGDPMDDSTNVFTTDLDGDTLTLTADPSDPRNTSTDGPTELVMTRQAPWGSELEGTWDYTQTGPTDLIPCTSPAIGESEMSEFTLIMTDRWWAEQEGYKYIWAVDDACSGSPTITTPSGLNGLQWLSEVDGDAVRWYTYDEMTMMGIYAEWTFAANGGDYDFTRVDCEPSADAICTAANTSFTISPAVP